MRLSCEHRIPMSAERFWSILHTPAYEARVADALGLAEYREVERREEPQAVFRRIEARPRALSPAMQKLLQRAAGVESASYVEEQWRSRDAMEVRWRAVPSVLRDRTRVEGVVRVEPIDEDSCLRILEGEVEIRVPVLRRILERTVVAAAVDAYGRSARLVPPETAAAGQRGR